MPESPTLETDIQTDRFRAWRRPDGFSEIDWQPGFTIDAEVASAAVIAGEQVGGGIRRGLLIDMRASGMMNREARAIFVAAEPWVHAVALWVSSPMSMVIANFFLGVSRASVPTRMFTKEADAISWLRAHCP